MQFTDVWCLRMNILKCWQRHMVMWGLTFCRTIADQMQSISFHQSPVRFLQSWQQVPNMNCRWVNSVLVWERCSSGVISACLRHWDAVPYLTMLLFCKSSAAVWSAKKERWVRGQGMQSVEILTDVSGWEERPSVCKRKWGTEPKMERCLVEIHHFKRLYEGLLCKWSAWNCLSATSSSPSAGLYS